MMTLEERLLATIRFEAPDRPWRMESLSFWNETVKRWHGEGLPRYVLTPEIAMMYFKNDYWAPIMLGHDDNPGLWPPFMPKILEIKEDYMINRTFSGATLKRFRNLASALPQHISAPVHNMDDFRALRWRLNPDFPGRCDNPAWDAMIAFGKLRRAPVVLHVIGLFAFHRSLMGVEKLMYAYFDQPELIHAMGRAWERLTTGIARNFARKTGVAAITFWEDMCGVSGPLVSPRIFREFITPYYRRTINAARETGVPGFMVDTDGDCSLLIPLFVDVGVNFMYPFEVQAGMDILKVREEWGTRLAIMGGIDKRLLERSEDDIEREVMSIVPKMLEASGYVPSIDHCVHPDVPLKNFEFFVDLLRNDPRMH